MAVFPTFWTVLVAVLAKAPGRPQEQTATAHPNTKTRSIQRLMRVIQLTAKHNVKKSPAGWFSSAQIFLIHQLETALMQHRNCELVVLDMHRQHGMP